MTTTSEHPGLAEKEIYLQPLQQGERLDQLTFHKRHEAMREEVRAELVGGIVYLMPSPVSVEHGDTHHMVSTWLGVFQSASPGVVGSSDVTLILGLNSEPRPDACLRVLPEYGGRTRKVEKYIHGAPEFIVEVAVSSAAYDLEEKKRDYQGVGIDEYLVVLPETARVLWFVLQNQVYQPLPPNEDGIMRSRRFPGLWLDPHALLEGDLTRVIGVVQQGIQSPDGSSPWGSAARFSQVGYR